MIIRKSTRKFSMPVRTILSECPECQTEFEIYLPKGASITGVERDEKFTQVWMEVKEEDADKQGRKVTMHEETGDVVLWLIPINVCGEIPPIK